MSWSLYLNVFMSATALACSTVSNSTKSFPMDWPFFFLILTQTTLPCDFKASSTASMVIVWGQPFMCKVFSFDLSRSSCFTGSFLFTEVPSSFIWTFVELRKASATFATSTASISFIRLNKMIFERGTYPSSLVADNALKNLSFG